MSNQDIASTLADALRAVLEELDSPNGVDDKTREFAQKALDEAQPPDDSQGDQGMSVLDAVKQRQRKKAPEGSPAEEQGESPDEEAQEGGQ